MVLCLSRSKTHVLCRGPRSLFIRTLSVLVCVRLLERHTRLPRYFRLRSGSQEKLFTSDVWVDSDSR